MAALHAPDFGCLHLDGRFGSRTPPHLRRFGHRRRHGSARYPQCTQEARDYRETPKQARHNTPHSKAGRGGEHGLQWNDWSCHIGCGIHGHRGRRVSRSRAWDKRHRRERDCHQDCLARCLGRCWHGSRACLHGPQEGQRGTQGIPSSWHLSSRG